MEAMVFPSVFQGSLIVTPSLMSMFLSSTLSLYMQCIFSFFFPSLSLGCLCRMADHDRRREAMKRKISQARESVHTNQEMGIGRNYGREVEQIKEGEVDEDHDHYRPCLACTAKAA